jgi:hypothetical protein
MGESAASAQKTPRRKICGATLLSSGLFSGALSSQSQPIKRCLRGLSSDDFEAFLEDAFEVFDRATL